jgi:hypothetical protein
VRVAGQATTESPVAADIQIIGGPSGKEQKETAVPAKAPGVVTVDLETPGVWYVRARATGFWGETRVLVTPHAGEPVELRLWPSATLRAELTAPARLSRVGVRFQPVLDEADAEAKRDAFPTGTSDCQLDGRRVECVIPAGLADYSLRSAGYVPVYRWNQKHSPGEIVSLGRVEFRKGSSLVGRVRIAQDAVLEKGSRVRINLEPNRASIAPPEEEKRSRIAGATAFASPRGIFVFEGVKPSGYQISATAPGLISETREVTILDALEAELREPIELAAPATLEVTITPPIDPWGRTWTVELLRIDPRRQHTDVVASSSPGVSGRWRQAGLAPAQYILNVRRHPQGVWHSQMTTVDGDVHLDVNILLVRVVGALTLGGAPIAGSLWFGGERGAVSVPITTDGGGLFRGILPAVDGGTWSKVDVVAEHPTVRRGLRDVRIAEPNSDGISRVDIDLPSNKVFGEVTTDRGTPVSSATVFLSVPGETGELLQTHADASGQFSFNGLEAATYSVRAIGRSGKSDSVNVAVDETSQEFVTLTLKESGELHGVVSSRYGSVAGARVSAYPDNRSGFDLVEWNTTGPDGRFSVIVPPQAQHVTVTVAAPGFGFHFFRPPVDPQRPALIQLDQDGGRLSITMNGPDLPFVFHAGGFLALQDLLGDGIAVIDGPTITADNLRSGQYELCIATPAEALAFAQTTRPKERCTGGFLPPGGHLALDAPRHATSQRSSERIAR